MHGCRDSLKPMDTLQYSIKVLFETQDRVCYLLPKVWLGNHSENVTEQGTRHAAVFRFQQTVHVFRQLPRPSSVTLLTNNAIKCNVSLSLSMDCAVHISR